ncbi:MAG: hypothetical protein ACP5QA_01655 [Phycisphaerae bacterium]
MTSLPNPSPVPHAIKLGIFGLLRLLPLFPALRFSKNPDVEITILHVVKPKRPNADQPLGVRELVDRLLPGTDGGN